MFRHPGRLRAPPDAFSPSQLLDSFAMQLVLRSDASPLLPKDPWRTTGVVPGAAITSDVTQGLKQSILYANSWPGEYASVPGPTALHRPKFRRGFDLKLRVPGAHHDSRDCGHRCIASNLPAEQYFNRQSFTTLPVSSIASGPFHWSQLGNRVLGAKYAQLHARR